MFTSLSATEGFLPAELKKTVVTDSLGVRYVSHEPKRYLDVKLPAEVVVTLANTDVIEFCLADVRLESRYRTYAVHLNALCLGMVKIPSSEIIGYHYAHWKGADNAFIESAQKQQNERSIEPMVAKLLHAGLRQMATGCLEILVSHEEHYVPDLLERAVVGLAKYLQTPILTIANSEWPQFEAKQYETIRPFSVSLSLYDSVGSLVKPSHVVWTYPLLGDEELSKSRRMSVSVKSEGRITVKQDLTSFVHLYPDWIFTKGLPVEVIERDVVWDFLDQQAHAGSLQVQKIREKIAKRHLADLYSWIKAPDLNGNPVIVNLTAETDRIVITLYSNDKEGIEQEVDKFDISMHEYQDLMRVGGEHHSVPKAAYLGVATHINDLIKERVTVLHNVRVCQDSLIVPGTEKAKTGAEALSEALSLTKYVIGESQK
jgi:hypothetical protein